MSSADKAEADLAALQAHVADVIARCEEASVKVLYPGERTRTLVEVAAWLREFPKGDR